VPRHDEMSSYLYAAQLVCNSYIQTVQEKIDLYNSIIIGLVGITGGLGKLFGLSCDHNNMTILYRGLWYIALTFVLVVLMLKKRTRVAGMVLALICLDVWVYSQIIYYHFDIFNLVVVAAFTGS